MLIRWIRIRIGIRNTGTYSTLLTVLHRRVSRICFPFPRHEDTEGAFFENTDQHRKRKQSELSAFCLEIKLHNMKPESG
jgi:hypothetical protein